MSAATSPSTISCACRAALSFDESYDDPLADVTVMLFARGDMAKFAADKPLLHRPGTHWSYASGTSNIVAGVLRATFANEEDYLRYPRERLFAPLGMRSAVIAPDASGTLVGSSLLYASARDFARLGLLYLQDGVWQGNSALAGRVGRIQPDADQGCARAKLWRAYVAQAAAVRRIRRAADAGRCPLFPRPRRADHRDRAVARPRHRQARPHVAEAAPGIPPRSLLRLSTPFPRADRRRLLAGT